MRNGVGAALVVAGLIASGCADKDRAVPSAGGVAQPSSAAPGSPPPSTAAPESSPPSTAAPSPGTTAAPESPSPSAGPVEVRAADTRLGRILVDGRGMTVYVFTKDEADFQSACTGACPREWPPMVTNGQVNAGSGSNDAWVSTIDRPDGTRQVEYNGWPLYYHAKDTSPGDRKGQGAVSYGGPWSVVSADTGQPVKKK